MRKVDLDEIERNLCMIHEKLKGKNLQFFFVIEEGKGMEKSSFILQFYDVVMPYRNFG